MIALNCDGCVPIWHRIARRMAEDCQGIGRLLLGDRQRIARGLAEDCQGLGIGLPGSGQRIARGLADD